MLAEHQELWDRIYGYQIDLPRVAFPYSAKLAKEQGWSREFTLRVIEEYKKFVFLGLVAGHPVSPSTNVDAAWHQHILYTEDYFERFCLQTLGQYFHHFPSKGGDETSKLAEQYTKTLESYERFFGAQPPADIWPIATEPVPKIGRLKLKLPFEIEIKNPRLAIGLILGLVVIITILGCAVAPEFISPLDYTGPQFLWFYFFIEALALIVAGILRKTLRAPYSLISQDAPTPLEIAYMTGGRQRIGAVALVSLIGRSLVEVKRPSNLLVALTDSYPQGSSVERLLLTRIAHGKKMKPRDVHLWAQVEAGSVDQGAVRKGLAPSDLANLTYRLMPAVVTALPAILGVMKIQVGVERGRPVGILISFVLFTVVLALSWLRKAHTSCAGDKVLANLRASSSKRFQARNLVSPSYADDLVLMVALAGPASLLNTELDYLRTQLIVRNASWDSSSDSCSSGAGDAGGGGCGGGGGGGGGGCGGCGSH